MNKYRLRSSYFTTIISISLVLFVLGLMGLLVLNAKKLADYVKETITFSVFIKENSKEVEIRRLQKDLDASYYVKSTKFVDKEQAAKILEQELGSDFIQFLGYNPLLASIEVKLHARYANPDNISLMIKELQNNPFVDEVYYQKSLVHAINENVKNISVILLLFGGLLLLIAITLINNTVRLLVYSKRFIINTMQLVGATKAFIRKPFLYKSVYYGIFGSLLSILLLTGVIYITQKELQGVIGFDEVESIGLLFLGVLFIGLLISWISSYFAVNKYLNIKVDKLYY